MATKKQIEKLKKRKKELASRKNAGGNLIFFKADETKRLRPVPVGEEDEFGLEIVQFYLGQEIKGVISAHTFEEPCAIMEMYNKLKDGDEEDRDLAATFKPKQKFVVPVYSIKDPKDKVIDEGEGVRLALLTSGQYQDLVDYYLDEEKGDFTNPSTGYDIKFSRTGSGQYDTEYSTLDCKPTKLPKKLAKVIYSPSELVRNEIPTYEESERLINQFLGIDGSDEDEDESPKKKSLKKKKKSLTKAGKKTSKKKKKSDL